MNCSVTGCERWRAKNSRQSVIRASMASAWVGPDWSQTASWNAGAGHVFARFVVPPRTLSETSAIRRGTERTSGGSCVMDTGRRTQLVGLEYECKVRLPGKSSGSSTMPRDALSFV